MRVRANDTLSKNRQPDIGADTNPHAIRQGCAMRVFRAPGVPGGSDIGKAQEAA